MFSLHLLACLRCFDFVFIGVFVVLFCCLLFLLLCGFVVVVLLVLFELFLCLFVWFV